MYMKLGYVVTVSLVFKVTYDLTISRLPLGRRSASVGTTCRCYLTG